MVVDTISVLYMFIWSENSVTHYINILIIITVTRGKSLASSVVRIPFIVEGAGEFILLLMRKLSGTLSFCSYSHCWLLLLLDIWTPNISPYWNLCEVAG